VNISSTIPFTIFNDRGMPVVCDTCSAPADFVWYGSWDGKPQYCCPAHNPVSLPAALPADFTGHTICPACGK